MEELVKMISEKTGLSPEMSTEAVNMVMGYLKKKLPAPIASQIDGVLSGESAASMVGGLFGKK